jgi:hypothetical protein
MLFALDYPIFKKNVPMLCRIYAISIKPSLLKKISRHSHLLIEIYPMVLLVGFIQAELG